MRYLMFATTLDGGEYCQIVRAQDDNIAIQRMAQYMQYYHRVPASELVVVAGVWERDPQFYLAGCLADLDNT